MTIAVKKAQKIRYYIFEVLSNFTVFIYVVPNILSRIVDDFHFFSFVMKETTVIFGKILLRYHTKLAVTISCHLIWFLPITKNSLQGTDWANPLISGEKTSWQMSLHVYMHWERKIWSKVSSALFNSKFFCWRSAKEILHVGCFFTLPAVVTPQKMWSLVEVGI